MYVSPKVWYHGNPLQIHFKVYAEKHYYTALLTKHHVYVPLLRP